MKILLDGGQTNFEPGETMRGRVEWLGQETPDSLEVRLLWYTEGRGDRDVGVARTLRIEGLVSTGSREFEFELPAGPYSCSGRLISICWAVEATLLPDDLTQRVEFLMAPDGREVEIAS